LFAAEMLANALMTGYSWIEVPLTHRERAYGQSKAVKLSNIFNAQITILQIWWSLRVRGQTASPPLFLVEPVLHHEAGRRPAH
jgi:hypothetical protein